ncbi:O-methyltransferase [Bacteroidota bacterium]
MKLPTVLMEQLLLYVQYRTRAGHRKGRGVHPPFAYEFIREAVFGRDPPGLEGIMDLVETLLGNRNTLEVSDLGAGSRLGGGTRKSIRELVKHTAVGSKKGRLLARIAQYFHFSTMIELGTGTGISSLYLAKSCPNSKILSCEGSSEIAALARQNISQMGISNIEVHNDVFLKWLPRVLSQIAGDIFVFLDGDHRGEMLKQYCSMIIQSAPSKAVLVLDDIHWSKDMNLAWKELLNRSEISLSLELYNTGIIFLGYGIQQDHFVVDF